MAKRKRVADSEESTAVDGGPQKEVETGPAPPTESTVPDASSSSDAKNKKKIERFVSKVKLRLGSVSHTMDVPTLKVWCIKAVIAGLKAGLVDSAEPSGGGEMPRVTITDARVFHKKKPQTLDSAAPVPEGSGAMQTGAIVEFGSPRHALAFQRQVHDNPTYSHHAASGSSAVTAEFVVENSEHVAMRLQKKAEKEARMEALKASRTGPQQQVQNHAAAAAALREKKRLRKGRGGAIASTQPRPEARGGVGASGDGGATSSANPFASFHRGAAAPPSGRGRGGYGRGGRGGGFSRGGFGGGRGAGGGSSFGASRGRQFSAGGFRGGRGGMR